MTTEKCRAFRVTIDSLAGFEVVLAALSHDLAQQAISDLAAWEGADIQPHEIKSYRDRRFDALAAVESPGEWIGWVRGYDRAGQGCLGTTAEHLRRIIGLAVARRDICGTITGDSVHLEGHTARWDRARCQYTVDGPNGEATCKTASDACDHIFGGKDPPVKLYTCTPRDVLV